MDGKITKDHERGAQIQNHEKISIFLRIEFFLDKSQYIVVKALNYTKYTPSEHLFTLSLKIRTKGEVKWQPYSR